MPKMESLVILAVSILLSAIMIPIGMQQIVGTSTSTWNSAVTTLWQILLPVLVIVSIALYFIPKFGGGSD